MPTNLVVAPEETAEPFRIFDEAEDTALCGPPPPARLPATAPTVSADAVVTQVRIVELAAEPVDHARVTGPNHGPVVLLDVSIPDQIERALLAILSAGPAVGETIESAYKRKEHELGAAFARLSPLEARSLQRRLTAARSDDAMATQFARMVEARRARLLAFLADARRRQALHGRSPLRKA
jgi:hypothetical protein